jgi:hypothetical protein
VATGGLQLQPQTPSGRTQESMFVEPRGLNMVDIGAMMDKSRLDFVSHPLSWKRLPKTGWRLAKPALAQLKAPCMDCGSARERKRFSVEIRQLGSAATPVMRVPSEYAAVT